ncbi:MAG: AMP-binding protein [Arenicella sp.]|nr:AMP-binding protein [Arenicella sp.]
MSISKTIALKSGERSITHGGLQKLAAKAANVLNQTGVARGDTIALLLRNDFQYFILSEAGRYLGAGITPVNWHLTPSEVDYILKDCAASVLVVHSDLYSPELRELCKDITVWVEETPLEIATAYQLPESACELGPGDESLHDAVERAEPLDLEIDPPVPALFYTSGTTGKPKAVVKNKIPPEAAKAIAARSAFAFGLRDAPFRAVMTGPLYHSAPNAYALYIVRLGGTLVLQPRFDALDLLSIIEQDEITHLHMVPTMFQRLLALNNTERKHYDLQSLQQVVHGAAPCSPDVKERMIEWLGEVVGEYYAMTEVGIITCSTSRQWLENRGTVGCAPAGVEILIRDDDGNECEVSTPGNICIRHEATHAFSYHNADGKADSMRQDNFVDTGDIGYLNENGFLFISDRKTDMVLSGGVNIYPAEVEAALTEIEKVRDSAVFGIPHPEFGEQLVAVLEADSGIDTDKVQAILKQKIAGYKVPRLWQVVDCLPREDSGKVKKRILKVDFLNMIESQE